MITMVLKIIDSKTHYIIITYCNRMEQLDISLFKKISIGVKLYTAYTFIFIISINERISIECYNFIQVKNDIYYNFINLIYVINNAALSY